MRNLLYYHTIGGLERRSILEESEIHRHRVDNDDGALTGSEQMDQMDQT